jgi:hypothetical protein
LVLLLARSFAAETFADHTYYLGDPHAHTGLSNDAGDAEGGCEGCGSSEDAFQNARAAGLDWVAFTDHVNGSPTAQPDEWEAFQARVLEADDGDLVTVPAAELWLARGGGSMIGHVSFLAFGDDAQLAGLSIEELRPAAGDSMDIGSCSALWSFMEGFTSTRGPALALPHHPALSSPAPWDWSCADAEWAPAVEVYSEHGSSMGDGLGWDPPWSVEVEKGTVHAALDPDRYALQLGFLAGSDEHDTWPGRTCALDAVRTNHLYAGGLTMVVLEDGQTLDREAIRLAILEHRTYGTSGPAVPVSVAYATGGADLGEMGATLGLPEGQPLEVGVAVPEPWADRVTAVEVVGPRGRWEMMGKEPGEWALELGDEDLDTWVYVAVQLDGEACWGGDCEDGGSDDLEWAWLSPSWIEEAEPDLDADGVTWADGDCDDGDAGVHPGATEEWYDGVDQDCDGNDSDQDGDGYPLETDCDDADPAAHPGAAEVDGDGVDGDCDGGETWPGAGATTTAPSPVTVGDETGPSIRPPAVPASGCATGRGPPWLACVAGAVVAARRRLLRPVRPGGCSRTPG